MSRKALPQEILDGAYRIFIQEIEQQMTQTQFIFLEENIENHPLVRDATNIFHKIKGGAGFFGLKDIERTSGQLEKYLKNLKSSEHKGGAQEPLCVKELYSELVRLIQSLDGVG